MVAITDYASLTQALSDLSEDDGAEFIAYIPTAIDLAEERLIKELDFPELEKDITGTVSTNLISKPSDYRVPISLKLYLPTTSNKEFDSSFGSAFANSFSISGYINIKKRLSDFIEDYWPNAANVATPKYYGDVSSTAFIIAPTPSTSYLYKLRYTGSPIKLSNQNISNYFTDHCKDALFAAAMLEMSLFMKAWSQVSVWQQKFEVMKTDWNAQASRQRRDGGEIPMNTQGAPNTIKHLTEGNS